METNAGERRSALMPRYYFTLASGMQDDEGTEFADDEAARREAILIACDLSRNARPTNDERVIVTREDGSLVYEANLQIAAMLK